MEFQSLLGFEEEEAIREGLKHFLAAIIASDICLRQSEEVLGGEVSEWWRSQ